MKYLPMLLGNLFLLTLNIHAQDTIFLQNPSFEISTVNCNEMPHAWEHCGSSTELPPSIQPGCLGVSQAAFDGERYMSLVTRKNENIDRICQVLPEDSRLQKDSLYTMRVYLAHSRDLRMAGSDQKWKKWYNEPAALRIAGYNSAANAVELLAVSPVIDHEDWIGYDFTFSPEHRGYDVILFEAYFSWYGSGAANGNLLIDSISPIIKISMTEFTAGKNNMLFNPSFEGKQQCCIVPKGWVNCGLAIESPPDIQPGSFGVRLPATDGKTYLGMVARDNNSVEMVGQRLKAPLVHGTSYVVEVSLARAENFLSFSRMTGDEVYYSEPIKLQIWGGKKACEKSELLAESPLITNSTWERYKFSFKPENGDYKYLMLMASYNENKSHPQNGNILIDKISLEVAPN
ncbi:MAG: hypothetical protein R3D58_21165 [Saprospiraceae bacterium]